MRHSSFRLRAPHILPVFSLLVLALGACSPPEPPKVPVIAKPKPLEIVAEAPVDLAPVPEPQSLLAVGRISHAEESSKLLAAWSGFPVPSASEMLRAAAGEEDLGSLVDLGKPIDFVARMGGNLRSPSLSFVVSIPLVSLDEARSKLHKHKMTPMANGMTRVFLSTDGDGDDDDKSDKKVCVLSPSAGTSKARLVCGDGPAIEALAPYALRNLSAKPVSPGDPDMHLEVRVSAVHDAVSGMRRLLPMVVGGFLDNKNGVGTGTREIVEATIGDLADFAVDSDKFTFDLVARPDGAKATAHYVFKSHDATLTKVLTHGAATAGPPPPALLRLPADVDFAAWARPIDKTLLERPRKLLGALLDEALDAMPPPERRAFVDTFVAKTLPLAEGGWVFGHGLDLDALTSSLGAMHAAERDSSRGASKPALMAADKAAAERKKAAFEQMAGYSLVELERPHAEVSQVVKDWVSLGNRLVKVKKAKDAPTVRVTAVPAGLKLPAKTTHVEISVPRPVRRDEKGKVTFTPTPVVCHLFVVPGDTSVQEQEATWIGGGCDAKLVSTRLLAARAAATGPTLGSRPESRDLAASISRTGFLMTPRMFALAKVVSHEEGALGALGRDGLATVLMTSAPEGPSKEAPGGGFTTTLLVPKAAVGATTGALTR